jgi:hypothetical protein
MRRTLATAALLALATAAGAQQAPAASKAPAKAAAPAPRPDTGLVMGSFMSQRIDGKPLPVTDLASDDQGVQYVIEFAQLVLAFKPNGEFRAALRYRQALAGKGQKLSQEPLQKMTVFGTWSRDGQALRFVPDPKRGGEGLRILAGVAAGRTVNVPFDYQNGRVTKRSTVTLVYDPKIF